MQVYLPEQLSVF